MQKFPYLLLVIIWCAACNTTPPSEEQKLGETVLHAIGIELGETFKIATKGGCTSTDIEIDLPETTVAKLRNDPRFKLDTGFYAHYYPGWCNDDPMNVWLKSHRKEESLLHHIYYFSNASFRQQHRVSLSVALFLQPESHKLWISMEGQISSIFTDLFAPLLLFYTEPRNLTYNTDFTPTPPSQGFPVHEIDQ